MSGDNVEVVRRNVDAFNRRDMGGWLATFHPDAEIDWSCARGPQQGVYRGPGGQEAFWNVWLTFDWAEIEMHDIAETDSEVVVPNSTTFRGRQGIEVVARSAFVFTVENGQITRQRLFQERTEALEAVGLME